MERDQYPFPAVNEVNGINLDNYYPHQSSFNTVIYVHKRFLNKPQGKVKKEVKQKKKKEPKKKILLQDKAVNCDIQENTTKKELRNDSVLQETIKFAKNITPLVIPPSEGNETPVFYTIKTCNKCDRKREKMDKNQHEDKQVKRDDVTFEKKKPKKVIETIYRKQKNNHRAENYSGRDSVTPSTESNTFDDVNMNQSLCYTLSELSDKKDKNYKKGDSHKRKKEDSERFVISESFEGLATELNDIGETKIKIHLMNEKEKRYLSESIRVPVISAVKDCISEFNNIEVTEKLYSMQKFVRCNAQKLDTILDKLTSIEQYLANTNVITVNSPKPKALRASRLEQLGEDILDEKEYSTEEEVQSLDLKRHRNEVTTVVHEDKRKENLGCGEIPGNKTTTSVGVRTDRPSRLPARFCWTDSDKNN